MWDSLVLDSSEAWYRHLRLFRDYTITCLAGSEGRDLSFFIEYGDQIVGLAPIIIFTQTSQDKKNFTEAGYYGVPLPWPCYRDDFKLSEVHERAVFEEIERRVKMYQATRIQFVLSSPNDSETDAKRFSNIIRSRDYLDASYFSHWIVLDNATVKNIRTRYQRYVKKHINNYKVEFLSGNSIQDSFIDKFMEIHIKDAGGQFRSRNSYISQLEIAREGLAFFCVATCIATQEIVGALFVLTLKGQAYDGSVAIDPRYEQKYVSHVLKWKTIEYLLTTNIHSYELGIKAELPTWQNLPSKKNYGISFFKEGWARGGTKKVLVAEKFFDAEALKAELKKRSENIKQFFGFVG